MLAIDVDATLPDCLRWPFWDLWKKLQEIVSSCLMPLPAETILGDDCNLSFPTQAV